MSFKNEYTTYMGHHWIQVQGDQVVVGINEDALKEVDEIEKINFPEEGEEVVADEPCGDVDTSDGTLNIYSPVDGTIAEINTELRGNPGLLFEDPYEDGWLIKVDPKGGVDLADVLSNISED